MIYRHRTLVLACTVYSTPDVHAFFDKRVFIAYSYTSLSLGTGQLIVKVSRSDVNQTQQQQQQRDIRKITKNQPFLSKTEHSVYSTVL